MSIGYLIEIAVSPDTSTTERGRVLERFARRFLETQNYRVKENVRLTASEVDLLCTENTTGERIFVECKAHRSNISAEVLQKLLGNVVLKNYAAGWLISTFALGKDAKGFEEEWSEKVPEERRKLHIYPPDQLIERLVNAKIVVDVATLPFDRAKSKVGKEAFLLLTQNGEFWALPVLDPGTGIQSAALLFDAATGKRVTETGILDRITKTDTSLSLPWIVDTADSQATATSKLKTELESIVGVPVADHWADYRPARPGDFVGRESVLSTVFNILDMVRARSSPTRLIALKAPSGWGKSSTVLKIASRAAKVINKGKYFIFPIDSRAATTRRFPELAVVTAIKEAVNKGFIKTAGPLEFGGSSSLFSTPEMRAVADILQREEKVLCIFFDQFEELLYKADLSEIFDEMVRICTAVEEAQANIVIGFSWKTDGVIPTEHNAYHMWHTLADRRSEIELAPFTEKEVSLAITRFAKELGQPVIPQVRRLLQDHCQGFPWLLKKLCVHIIDLSRNGIEQIDILNRSMDIQTLFKKDLEKLSSPETGCIKQIAAESPAEFFKITQDFGDETVSRLVDKRLVIRSGTRLTIYWDIFRDYILTEKIPYIPVTYVPQANFSRYVKALAYLDGKSEITYADLGNQMSLGDGATDNLVRDLVNVGHVKANRKEHRIVPTFKNEVHAIEIAFSFWRSHEVVRRLLAGKPNEGSFTEAEFIDVYRAASKRSALGERTIHTYALRMLRWLVGIELVLRSGNSLIVREASRSATRTLDSLGAKRLNQSNFFLGEAPPAKVVAALQTLCSANGTRAKIEEQHGRNTCHALVKLGLMRRDGKRSVNVSKADIEAVIAERALHTPTISFVRELLTANATVSGLEVGSQVAQQFSMQWSESSQRRNGTALRQWANWSQSTAQSSLG